MDATPPPAATEERWAVTLGFWVCLLIAAALLAAVALAPRLQRVADLRATHTENRLRLAELERQAGELEAVARALERDPRYVAELAKRDLGATRTGDERIPLPAALHLGANTAGAAETGPLPSPRPTLPPAVLLPLATHVGLRATLLTAAATLALLAFTALHGTPAAGLAAALRRARGRYRPG